MSEKPARFTRTFSSKLLLADDKGFCKNATGSNERMMKLATCNGMKYETIEKIAFVQVN
jgi:hypothetical protein